MPSKKNKQLGENYIYTRIQTDNIIQCKVVNQEQERRRD